MRSIIVALLIGFIIGAVVADMDKSKSCDKKYRDIASKIINEKCQKDLKLEFKTENANHLLVCSKNGLGEGCVLRSEENKLAE